MSNIEVFCINNCPNCKKICMMLDRANIAYAHYNIDESPENLAEGAFRGILSEQFPVIFIDGRKLPAATPIDYFNTIKEVSDE